MVTAGRMGLLPTTLGVLPRLPATLGILPGLCVWCFLARLSLGIFFGRVGHGQHCSLCGPDSADGRLGPVTFSQAVKSRRPQCRR